MSHSERMSPVDTAWLRMDRPNNLMMITGVMALSGPVDVKALETALAERMLTHKRFRQRAVTTPAGAFWVNDRFATQHFQVLRAGSNAPSFHNFFADVGVGTGLIGIAAILTLILTTLRRAFRAWRASGSAMSVCWLVLSILPVNVGLVEPFLYRQHEFMLTWMVMLGVSLGEWQRRPSGRTPATTLPPRIPATELPGLAPVPARGPAAVSPGPETDT